ncbi:helix-turn-helix domain-containing protein [Wolbachia endosymbiont of Chironomus riparius]|uniref:helix-turn-helix domain-containing protein n=1 Tax=Wolbachia endosymbiont of Chironomus riparius TaxID=2883238 RepID=UPI00209FD715|nr:helix-turn-helix transcriptional regulator [Wolbachia endosymbiont of Chironomus riparius]
MTINSLHKKGSCINEINVIEKKEMTNIDTKLGKKIRYLRLTNGLTQSQLGKKVGVTFQQIQKYETGKNRVLVSRLYDLAEALSVTVQEFISDTVDSTKSTNLHENNESFSYIFDDVGDKEILGLVREYKKIENKKSRDAVYLLIKSLSSSQD